MIGWLRLAEAATRLHIVSGAVKVAAKVARVVFHSNLGLIGLSALAARFGLHRPVRQLPRSGVMSGSHIVPSLPAGLPAIPADAEAIQGALEAEGIAERHGRQS